MTTNRIVVAVAVAFAAVVLFVGNAQASTIATVEGDPSGTLVTLDANPVITYIAAQPGTGDGYTYTNYAILANDGTGSIDLFGHLPSGSTYVPAIGDAISVSGTFSPFNGIPEIGTMTAISQVSTGNNVAGSLGGGGTTPIPTVRTIPQLLSVSTTQDPTTEEYLVELDNVTFTAGANPFPTHATGSYTVSDGTNSLTVFFQPSTYSVSDPIAGTSVPAGPVDITGIIDAFGGTYNGSPVGGTPELIPFTITSVPEPSTFVLGGLSLLGLLAAKKHRRTQS
jgi:hypothetical protein